jgi:hypothetical protein
VYSLVGANTSSFQSLGAQLFILVGDQVDAEGELVDVRTLSTEIKDTYCNVSMVVVMGVGMGVAYESLGRGHHG